MSLTGAANENGPGLQPQPVEILSSEINPAVTSRQQHGVTHVRTEV
jgi:hypothetical protein